jgi:protocatechuate 3,4-dioxygenase beta subunit
VLAGRVIDHAGAPVADIRVRANPESHNAKELFAFTTTDAEGRFVLHRLGPGRYRPSAQGPTAFGRAEAMVTLAFGEPAPAVVIATGPAATVHVRVEAPAALDGCEGDWLEGFTETNRYSTRLSGSRATLHGVPPGRFGLLTLCGGQRTHMELEVGEVEALDVTLPVEASATVTGRVALGEDGLGSFMRIDLIPEGTVLDGPMLPEGTVDIQTDANGRFAAALPRAGGFEAIGSTIGGSSLPLRSFVVAEGEQLDLGMLPLPALGRIEGRVVDPDGHGVGGLNVRARHTAGLGDLTRADGTFSLLQVIPGDYELEVGQQLVLLQEGTVAVSVIAGKATSVELSVPRLDGKVAGVVVDAEGEPVPDAKVEIAALRPGLIDERSFRVVARVQADAEGRFARAELRPGTYELEVSALVGEGNGEARPGCKGEARTEVEAGGSAPDVVVTCR